MEISSDLAELVRIRAFVRWVCQDLLGPVLDEDSAGHLALAVHEAASNIMIHAYQSHTDRKIQVKAEVFDHQVSVRLYHLGEVFNPEAAKLPAFDGSQESGFGLHIIAQCVDEVNYSRNLHERNWVQLVKNREGSLRLKGGNYNGSDR